MAAEISRKTSRRIVYRDLSVAEYTRVLMSAGLPETAVGLADADRALARGDLYVDSGDLSRLIGRPATPLRDAIAAALR